MTSSANFSTSTSQPRRRTVNVEAKLLLLSHAFESLGFPKVVFKTEALNEQSLRAIGALGAVEEGVFRKHLFADDCRPRDMVHFSILDHEWPDVRKRLLARLPSKTSASGLGPVTR